MFEERNTGDAPTTPRPAATVIVLRGGAETLEVLLVQRTPQARFMGGAWVFPGGAVDGDETDRAAGRRELREEAAIALDDDAALVPFSRWITPAVAKIRFDTLFFVTPLPDGAQPAVDGAECVDLRWLTPGDALDAHRRGEILLVFPTIKTFEQLRQFPSADAVLAHARTSEIRPIEPVVVGTGEHARIMLPEDAEREQRG